MTHTLKGIVIPIRYLTTKMSKASAHRPRQPSPGFMNLYFSLEPLTLAQIDVLNPGNNATIQVASYLQQHAYGEHQFLLPVRTNSIERYEAEWGSRYPIKAIGAEPTTATYSEAIQLLPCSHTNFELFQEKLQILPFYLSIAEKTFYLHLTDTRGNYHAIRSQQYAPSSWPGFGHPVISLHYHTGTLPIKCLAEIEWTSLLTKFYQSEGTLHSHE